LGEWRKRGKNLQHRFINPNPADQENCHNEKLTSESHLIDRKFHIEEQLGWLKEILTLPTSKVQFIS
jgi:hypothetical protein